MHRETPLDTGVSRSPPSYATHRPSQESRLRRSLRISPPKTSASDSRLTVDYFQEDEPVVPLPEMSSSAPHSNPLEIDIEDQPSIGSAGNSDATLHDLDLQVQRTVSLTSENPSEAFFSADEEMNASNRSGLAKVVDVPVIPSGKKRFASDLSIGQGDAEARLSSHRSDYEINTPEHRSLPKRPQSTTDMVRKEKIIYGTWRLIEVPFQHGAEHRRIHGLATPIRKFNVSPKPEFRHFKAKCDVSDCLLHDLRGSLTCLFISAPGLSGFLLRHAINILVFLHICTVLSRGYYPGEPPDASESADCRFSPSDGLLCDSLGTPEVCELVALLPALWFRCVLDTTVSTKR